MSTDDAKKRILFAGYAPVHFVCFLPIYQQLRHDPRVELWLTGGFKVGADDRVSYVLDGFYDKFPVDRSRVIPLDQAMQQEFDVTVCAHLSDTMVPPQTTQTVQIFHGVSFKNFAVRERALKFDWLCIPGRYHAELYEKHGLIRPEGARCLLTGFPKVDRLVDGSLDRVALLTALGLDPARPTVLYAPTGGKQNSLETVGESVIQQIRADGRWNLLVKPHDHPKNAKPNWFEQLAPLENERIRLVREWDVVPFLHAADLLMTDASSVSVEYTLLDRPLVFLDAPKLFAKVVAKGAPLDLETYGRKTGTVVKADEDAIAAIADELANPTRTAELRQKMAQHVFHDPGHATQRVTQIVRHAAGLEAALPDTVPILNPSLSAG